MDKNKIITKYFGKEIIPRHLGQGKFLEKQLTQEDYDLLYSLFEGAVVFDYADAQRILKLQKQFPEYITINDDIDGCARVLSEPTQDSFAIPYFAAFLTEEGMLYLSKQIHLAEPEGDRLVLDSTGYHLHKKDPEGNDTVTHHNYFVGMQLL